MARIVYALSGQGRGHTSRGLAIAAALRDRGHEILFCGGATAHKILEDQNEPIVSVPALRQIMKANRVQYGQTLWCNGKTLLRASSVVNRLETAFREFGPDLLITDFEAFSPHAARRLDIPVLSFNHQQVVTEMKYSLPIRHWPGAMLTAAAIRLIVPSDPAHVLLTSFFFGELKNPDRTTLVPPIIRPAVQALTPSTGDHVLVYFNHADGARNAIDVLAQVDAHFVVYCDELEAHELPDNVTCKSPCLDGFLADLASSRAVICTAGFTLISEALYLGKPLLVTPNGGIFEQTLNALFLEREGLGKAVMDRPLTPDDVKAVLKHRHSYRERLQNYAPCGNQKAVECIEQNLMRLRFTPDARPVVPHNQAARVPDAPSSERFESF